MIPPEAHSGGGDILGHFAATRGAHLHARGKAATAILLSRLRCTPGDSVLELGCGTGATLVACASRYPEAKLTGTDVSESMLAAAASRLRFCGLTDRVALALMADSCPTAFPSGAFNTVYCESVLAIQGPQLLPRILMELRRILAPGGSLWCNETLWCAGTSKTEIERINDQCKRHFGIVQSNSEYTNTEAWAKLFESHSFTVLSAEPVDGLPPAPSPAGWAERRSAAYSLAGKVRTFCTPRLLRAELRYRRSAASLAIPPQTLEGVLFELRKTG